MRKFISFTFIARCPKEMLGVLLIYYDVREVCDRYHLDGRSGLLQFFGNDIQCCISLSITDIELAGIASKN